MTDTYNKVVEVLKDKIAKSIKAEERAQSVLNALQSILGGVNQLKHHGMDQLIEDIMELSRVPVKEIQVNAIWLTPTEVQSKHDRVRWAEGLIEQLPDTHEGRNSWLLNYGQKEIAIGIRKLYGTKRNRKWEWDPVTQSAVWKETP